MPQILAFLRGLLQHHHHLQLRLLVLDHGLLALNLHQLRARQAETHFPRSMVMRFITQETTLRIVKNIAFSILGARALKAIFTGFSFVRLARAQRNAHRLR